MIGWIVRWWNARRRAIDLQVLWPELKRQAPSLEVAKAVFFFVHASNDPAWLELGEGGMLDAIDKLE